jgi:PAS domain S-box-containing protein
VELEDLRARLAEAEEVLRAIRDGEVDAVVVAGERGEQVYTLSGADRAYRQLIETMSEGAATLSADGLVLYGNGRLAEMLARPLDQVMGSALRDHLPPADQQELDAILAHALTAPSHGEINLKTSAGRLVPVYLSADRLPSEEAGMTFCLVLTDLTEQRVQTELRESEARFRTFFELPLHGKCITSPEKGWLEVNDRLCEILGCAREELVRKTWAEMTHLEDLAADVAQFDRLLSGESEQYRLEKRFIRKDGSTVWTEISVGCVRKSDGAVDQMICVVDDITERKALESRLAEALLQANAANNAKSEFLGIMAHELRNPLSGVLGFAQLLSDTALDDEQKGYVRRISSSGEHLLAVVNDTLDFSSIEAGTLAIHPAPFDLAPLVKLSSDIVRKSAADKGLAFHCDVAAGVPAQITGDERRIRQILINLLGNAIKFTASGSVVLRVTRSGGSLDFSVEDTGLGISSEVRARLFQLFTQADSTINQKYGGTGIGLAVSQRLAEAMGGTISVVSTPGKGSTFTFRLPLAPPTGGTGVPPVWAQNIAAENSAAHGLPFRQAKGPELVEGDAHAPCPDLVLVVDDDADSRTLAGKMLQGLGYRSEFATDGTEAVQSFVPGKYFAILMDMAMPAMDGLEASKKIREIEAAAGGHVPIIAFTANMMPCERERPLAVGMDDYLSKPFKRAELAAKLARVAQIERAAEGGAS